MEREALAMLAAGLAGGFGHCVGMCGPIVASLSVGNLRAGWPEHLLYNLGRIMTYATLGAAAGATGSFLALILPLESLQRIVMAAGGLFIVLLGLITGQWLPFGREIGTCTPAMPLVRKTLDLFNGSTSTGAWFPLGLAFGFLPCGLTYTALLTAARASMDAPDRFSGMLRGGFFMLLFGIGTAPSLLLLGSLASRIGAVARKRLYRLATLIMIGTGLSFIAGALRW